MKAKVNRICFVLSSGDNHGKAPGISFCNSLSPSIVAEKYRGSHTLPPPPLHRCSKALGSDNCQFSISLHRCSKVPKVADACIPTSSPPSLQQAAREQLLRTLHLHPLHRCSKALGVSTVHSPSQSPASLQRAALEQLLRTLCFSPLHHCCEALGSVATVDSPSPSIA